LHAFFVRGHPAYPVEVSALSLYSISVDLNSIMAAFNLEYLRNGASHRKKKTRITRRLAKTYPMLPSVSQSDQTPSRKSHLKFLPNISLLRAA
jgi:hypothetical protein